VVKANGMQKIQDYIKLFWINLLVSCRGVRDYLATAFLYYSNFQFCKIDHYLFFSYLFDSPFSISKRFLTKTNADEVYAYGETPLSTLGDISAKCGITDQDVVFELGCGRGRSCFWFNQILGCKVVGIEVISDFVQIAEKIKNTFELKNIEFRNENMLESDFNGGTVFYLYGTSFDESLVTKLVKKLEKMPPGTKVISVSYPLSDYGGEGVFEVMRRFPARFTWGVGDVYLQVRK